jgi:class IV lanthipeptide synthase
MKEEPLPGLFVGHAGAALLFLILHEVLQTQEWLDRACFWSRRVAAVPCPSPDLFHGLAGRGLLQAWVFEHSRDDVDLKISEEVAYALQKMAVRDADGIHWDIPEGCGDLSGPYLGIAHGVAGVACFLTELNRAHTGSPYRQLADDALHSLARAARLNGTIGCLDWPDRVGGSFRGGVWCHGAAGIAQAFAHAAMRTHNSEWLDWAKLAGVAATRQAHLIGPTACHGVTGLIEAMLDVHRATEDPEPLAIAEASAGWLIDYFMVETEVGHLVSSERPDVFSPELMVGAAGPAAALARLLAPSRFGSMLMSPRESWRALGG